ncbi:MAG: sodium ABC transporter [Chloroflexi bacterium RBG_13_46_9]|jgi:ABC-2 type transport system ATP-binding protein|nr:MAG: sodium ABC transporter [Chloroflexi bacterium RBG_13_46_9]
MLSVEVNHITKVYGTRAVVNDVSFTVNPGEILGMIGPNGAGKTTTIRMMMDIIKPDHGDIKILGEKINENSKNLVGYLPEERGLYRKMNVIDSIIYFASLKGMDNQTARQRSDDLLKRVDMLPHKNKKVEELSRGMGQIIQVIVTVIHDPKLIILDEPTAGLDPVNAQLLKDMMVELRNRGKSVIMSTHRMNEIEELCDRVLMINQGQVVLYGGLAEIKSKFRNNSVIVEYEGDPGDITGIIRRNDLKQGVELVLDETTTPQQILERLVNKGVKVNRFELSTPSLNDIFIKVAGNGRE